MLRSKTNKLRAQLLALAFSAVAAPALACGDEDYVGSVCTFAQSWCPRGYVAADGSLLAISTNQALYSLLGVTYGGDARTTFGVPDLRGRSVIGQGTGPGLVGVSLGQKVGQQQVALTASQTPLQPHTHMATFQGVTGQATTVTVPASAGTLGVKGALAARQVAGAAQPQDGFMLGQGGSGGAAASIYVNPTTAGTDVALGGLDVELTGQPGNPQIQFQVPGALTGGTVTVQPAAAPASAAVSTQSPGLGMTVCIMSQGLYPPRP